VTLMQLEYAMVYGLLIINIRIDAAAKGRPWPRAFIYRCEATLRRIIRKFLEPDPASRHREVTGFDHVDFVFQYVPRIGLRLHDSKKDSTFEYPALSSVAVEPATCNWFKSI
jgi:hypothetical protein